MEAAVRGPASTWAKILRGTDRKRRPATRAEKILYVSIAVGAVTMQIFGKQVLFEEVPVVLSHSLAAAVPYLLAGAGALSALLAVLAVRKRIPAVPAAVAATLLIALPFFVQVRAGNSIATQAARIDEALISYDAVMKFATIDAAGDVAQQTRDLSRAYIVDLMVRGGADPQEFGKAPKKETSR